MCKNMTETAFNFVTDGKQQHVMFQQMYLPSALFCCCWSTFDLSERRFGLSFVCFNESDSFSFPRDFSALQTQHHISQQSINHQPKSKQYNCIEYTYILSISWFKFAIKMGWFYYIPTHSILFPVPVTVLCDSTEDMAFKNTSMQSFC